MIARRKYEHINTITLNEKTIDGYAIATLECEVSGANMLKVEVGTNGPQGGDTGYGCRTFIRIVDEGGTDIEIKPIQTKCGKRQGFEMYLGGDSELYTIIDALYFCANVLDSQKRL